MCFVRNAVTVYRNIFFNLEKKNDSSPNMVKARFESLYKDYNNSIKRSSYHSRVFT